MMLKMTFNFSIKENKHALYTFENGKKVWDQNTVKQQYSETLLQF